MLKSLAVLNAMPSAADFYRLYWNTRPFVVRGALQASDMEGLITPDELAGLSMEEAPQSRMVRTAGNHQDWSCAFGPFVEEDFSAAGDANWSLLVQNVEQFHPDTARLLRHFNFAPRWLMDDIMVSFSARGGSVGPHIDSYHVFLAQGQGKRRWKVGRQPMRDEVYIEGMELKVLGRDIEGDEIDVEAGDILYIPPKFGHQGTTLEPALTFSVGFLGPKISELFAGYGQYLSGFEDMDQRYAGEGLMADSAGFVISHAAATDLRGRLARQLTAMDFTQWLVEFFTESSHEDFGNYSEREDVLMIDEFTEKLRGGGRLIKPEYVKFAITSFASDTFCLGFDSQSFVVDVRLLPVVQTLMKEDAVSLKASPGIPDKREIFAFLLELYNHQALEFSD